MTSLLKAARDVIFGSNGDEGGVCFRPWCGPFETSGAIFCISPYVSFMPAICRHRVASVKPFAGVAFLVQLAFRQRVFNIAFLLLSALLPALHSGFRKPVLSAVFQLCILL